MTRTPSTARLTSSALACLAGATQLTQETEAPSVADLARHDFPYPSKYADVGGARMHYVEAGEGDPILFLHGNPTWSYLWRNVLPHVEGSGRVVALDLIGFGKSDKPELDYTPEEHYHYLSEFIEVLGLNDLVLVVHDWGSWLGFRWAAEHASAVRGVAFMEALLPVPSAPAVPEPFRARVEEFGRLIGAAGLPDKGPELVLRDNVFVERLMPLAIVRTLTEDERNAYREPFLDPAHRKPILAFRQARAPAIFEAVRAYTDWLATSDAPKLMLAFSPGFVGSEGQVAWVRENVANVAVVDAGEGLHYVQEDRPDAIGRAIATWMVEKGL